MLRVEANKGQHPGEANRNGSSGGNGNSATKHRGSDGNGGSATAERNALVNTAEGKAPPNTEPCKPAGEANSLRLDVSYTS